MILTTPRTDAAVGVLDKLQDDGYTLGVRTRVEVSEAHGGAHSATYADKLLIKGPTALTLKLRESVAEHRDELLAAACVMDPPVSWLRVLIDRYHSGYAIEVRRIGWKGPYRIRIAMIAANVAGFMGLHPAHDGPRLEAIIEEVLR